MKWATRSGMHVDRAGCAWLIRRMIDPAADFVFVDAPAAPGLDIIIRGLSLALDDDTVLGITGTVFDGLYEYFKRSMILGRNPA
ncbi:chromate resistance protein ChrB domain-containing protein [Arthrobacter sp. MMS18-M83]|uniref:chromate resistance protein ChrB domain-containing protein n=1 Tax=Arthrobacter sp. MMS18-M83 TaxID=2996261 RepID=UPI00227ACA48|nr:chromate resistance protein ChrB domain-containing protein [Arthrobacter sp. MMS18-M83]WAH95287.1 chromate resistance protein [Arthrobacter sp. MMS18-M83]